jgi:hypothetical protein
VKSGQLFTATSSGQLLQAVNCCCAPSHCPSLCCFPDPSPFPFLAFNQSKCAKLYPLMVNLSAIQLKKILRHLNRIWLKKTLYAVAVKRTHPASLLMHCDHLELERNWSTSQWFSSPPWHIVYSIYYYERIAGQNN